MRSVLFAVVLALNLGAGDGPRALPPSATQTVAPPDLQRFPTARAPNELGTVTLPDTPSAIEALFGRLPSEIAGHVRSPQFDRMFPERPSAGYGEDSRIPGIRTPLVWIQAIDMSRGDFFPTHWTGGQVVAFMAEQRQEVKEAGRDGNLIWMHQEKRQDTVGSPERLTVYGTLWGRVDSRWIFSIQANARENREALLAAFVGAARSSPR